MLSKEFLSKLKSAKIFEAVSIYGASTWITIQVLATVTPYLNLPTYIVTGVIYCVIALFPFFLLERFIDTLEIEEEDSAKHRFYNRLIAFDLAVWPKYVLIGSILAICLIFAANKERNLTPTIPDIVLQDKLAVLYFENQTGNEEYDVIGPMVSHWLTEGFIQNGDVKIVSANSVQRVYQAGLGGVSSLTENISKLLGTKNVIDGSYFLQKDSIFLKANLINVETGDVLYAFGNFSGPKDEPITIIEDLREKVLGYWFNKENIKRYPAPRYDAYKKYIEAQSLWSEDNARVKSLLEESITLDPNFYEPLFLLIALQRNKRKWSYCDSLTNRLYNIKSELTNAQLDKLNFFRYELKGDYKSAYTYLKKEFDRDPEDLFMNTSLMVFANLKLNDPAECLAIAKEISIDSINLEDCKYCKTRLFNQTLAHHLLGNDAEFNRLLTLNSSVEPDSRIKQLQTIQLVKKENLDDLHNYINQTTSNDPRKYLDLYLVAIVDCLKQGNEAKAKQCLEVASKRLGQLDSNNNLSQELLGQYYDISREYDKSYPIYMSQEAKYPKDQFYLFRIACNKILSGNTKEGLALAKEVEMTKSDHDFGYTEYEMARVHALLGNTEKALDYLDQSIQNGRLFHHLHFGRDFYLRSLWNHPRFNTLLKTRAISPK